MSYLAKTAMDRERERAEKYAGRRMCYRGVTRTIEEWAAVLNIRPATMHARLDSFYLKRYTADQLFSQRGMRA